MKLTVKINEEYNNRVFELANKLSKHQCRHLFDIALVKSFRFETKDKHI